jgi:hypothetical protein
MNAAKAEAMIAEVVAESKRRAIAERTAQLTSLTAKPATVTEISPQNTAGTSQTTANATATELADKLWTATPTLAHIHQAAQARMVSPMAALGCVLARVAAFTPPSRCVPATIGGHVPLSLYPAIMADTGGGKSATAAVAADLLPNMTPGTVGPISLGSGEGVAEIYLEVVDVTEDDDTGAPRKVKRKRQTKYGALLVLDEGRALGEMARRTGATIVQTLCTAWVGGALGNANASAETYRHLPGGNYALGLITSWQPQKAAALFDDTDGGLPGRFLYVPADDIHAPDTPPPWPGALHWTPPALCIANDIVVADPVEYPASVIEAVRAERLHRLRGGHVAALDAHRMLHRLKIAGALATLENRRISTLEDWEIAGLILDVSDAVRGTVVDVLQATYAEREHKANERAAQREAHIASTAENRAIIAGAKSMARKAHTAPGEPFTRSALSQAASSRSKREASVDQMLARAIDEGWLVPSGEKYLAGGSQPA